MSAPLAIGQTVSSIADMGAITAASNMATKATAQMQLSQSLTSAVGSMAKGMGSNIKDMARPS